MAEKTENRKPAKNYLPVIDKLNQAIADCNIPRTVVNEMVGVSYITMAKYLDKERNIKDESIAKRMVLVTNILNKMHKKGLLPIEEEVNLRYRRSVILGLVDKFIQEK